jgi:hypothetical protein
MNIGDNSAALDTHLSPPLSLSRSAFRTCIDFLRSSVYTLEGKRKGEERERKRKNCVYRRLFRFAIKSLSCSFFHPAFVSISDKCPHRYPSFLSFICFEQQHRCDCYLFPPILRYEPKVLHYTYFASRMFAVAIVSTR